jgi:hypothetical protein
MPCDYLLDEKEPSDAVMLAFNYLFGIQIRPLLCH